MHETLESILSSHFLRSNFRFSGLIPELVSFITAHEALQVIEEYGLGTPGDSKSDRYIPSLPKHR